MNKRELIKKKIEYGSVPTDSDTRPIEIRKP
jgi:hypothetical protein